MANTQEMLRNEAQQQAGTPLDQDAVVAINETQKAMEAIRANTTDEAIAAIERATGKTDILLARNPSNALLPINQEVAILDTAPDDIDAIRDIALAAEAAVDLGNYPSARVLLYGLMSEIRVHIHNLPLGSYPAALSTAARLLHEKKNDDAFTVLQTALNTLVLTDRITPIPMLLAREAIREAQEKRDQDRENAARLLEDARQELLRAEELGYAVGDPDYKTLNDQLSALQRSLKNNEDTTSLFGKIRDGLASLLKRQSHRDYSQGQREQQAPAEPEKKAA